jgi:hypothetical protein
MIARVSLLIFVASILAPSSSFAKQCPADPYKASVAVWQFGALTYQRPATAIHPCGRKITCIGGRTEPPVVKRQCHWD